MAEFHYDRDTRIRIVQNDAGLGYLAYNHRGKRYVLEFDGETPVACVRLADGVRRKLSERDRIDAWKDLITDDAMMKSFIADIDKLNERGPFYEFIGDQPLSRPADEYPAEIKIYVGTDGDTMELKPEKVSELLSKLKISEMDELRKFMKKDPEY
ncbi:MAG: hypothetical protein V1648_03420 [Candidatus Aenigmatarchaeota archaeon]